MKSSRNSLKRLLLILALAGLSFLTACAGNNGTSLSQGTPSVTLTAADPYIVGAVFQEVGSDGNILQSRSTPSDANGQFHFPAPLTPGSTVEMIPGSQGVHAGASFTGILKVKVPQTVSGGLTVSPLTTLLANGVTQEQLLSLLQDAGLQNVTTADLTADPMAGLNSQTSVTDNQLRSLVANMAANAFMSAENNYNAGANALNDSANAALFQDLVAGIHDNFNAQNFSSLASTISAQTGYQVTVGDVANALAHLARTATDTIRTDLLNQQTQLTSTDISNLLQTAWEQAPTLVENLIQQRLAKQGGTTGANSGSGSATGNTSDGATLYADNCSGCHGPLSSSSKAGATATQIQNAINTVGAMSSLSTLSSADIQAIADALAPSTSTGSGSGTTTQPTTPDGATLYANNCSGCHGPLSSSSKAGATATQIQNAINTIGQMSALSTLSSADIQAIADALAPSTSTGSGSGTTTQPTTPDGATLYANNCSGCHGPLSSSSKAGATATQIQNAINTIGQMSALSTLSSADIQAIADALATTSTNTATDGPTLYADDCASCHGPLATSSQAGATASEIQSALNSVGAMSSLSTLSSADIQAIADALATSSSTGGDN